MCGLAFREDFVHSSLKHIAQWVKQHGQEKGYSTNYERIFRLEGAAKDDRQPADQQRISHYCQHGQDTIDDGAAGQEGWIADLGAQ